jgi:hypothetical protein
VPDDCAEMITFFNISGAMIYLDDAGRQIGDDRRILENPKCAALTIRPRDLARTTSTNSFDRSTLR